MNGIFEIRIIPMANGYLCYANNATKSCDQYVFNTLEAVYLFIESTLKEKKGE